MDATLDTAEPFDGSESLDSGHRRQRPAKVSLIVGLAIVVMIVSSGIIVRVAQIGHPDAQSLTHFFLPPSWSHPFGTDDLGRDIFTRVMYATWTDVQAGLITTYIPLVLGVALGVITGYHRGWLDAVSMRLVDGVLAFPFMVVVLVIVTIVGPGLRGVYVALIVKSWPSYTRISRAEMLVLREQEYILAAKTLGYSRSRILVRHALPQILRPTLIFSLSDLVMNILLLASLSYLGLGVQPPTPEWGGIIAEGQTYLLSAWWITTLPGVFVVVFGLGVSLCGEAIAERFNIHRPEAK
jgi:peptide/nickel transport system permease protein